VDVETIVTQPVFTKGNQTVCNTSTSEIYTVQSEANVQWYTWDIPATASFNGTSYTNSVDINWNGIPGSISVSANGMCETSPTVTRTVVIVSQSQQPDAILGPTTVCANEAGVTYSIQTPETGATYQWTKPSDATITSGGTGSTITVKFGSAGGTISAIANGACGPSASRSITIAVTPLPAAPGAIICPTKVCEGQTMTAQVPNTAGITYTWTIPSGWNMTSGQGTNSITATVGTTSGDISVTAKSSCGTSSATNQTVTVSPNGETLTITGTDKICPGADGFTYTVAGVTGASNFVWSAPVDAVITSGNGTASIDVDFGANSGNISVTANNACGAHTASLAISFEQLITSNVLPASLSVCENSSFTIIGNTVEPAENYAITWQQKPTLAGQYSNDVSSTTETLTGTSGAAGTILYYRRIAVYYGCIDTSNVCEVMTIENPKVISTNMDTVLCSNEEFLVPFIDIQGGVPGTWTHDGQGTLQNPTTSNPTYLLSSDDQSSLVTLEFTITPTNGCAANGQTGQYFLLVKANPVATGGGSEEICPTGFAIDINGFSGSTSLISWTHNGQGTLNNNTVLVPTYISSMSDAGQTVTFTMTVTESNCPIPITATATYDLVHRASIYDILLDISVGKDTTIEEGSLALLQGIGTNVFLYIWSPGATVIDSLKKLTSAKPKQTTNFVLTGFSDIGCIDRDTMIVTVNQQPDTTIFIPSLFSPNSDGTNDFWVIPSLVNEVGVNVAIYNREGNIVYENASYENNWDGTFEGVKLPDATYYYIVYVPGITEPLKGVVSILQR
jgi:gliding motility-associated-like protein